MAFILERVYPWKWRRASDAVQVSHRVCGRRKQNTHPNSENKPGTSWSLDSSKFNTLLKKKKKRRMRETVPSAGRSGHRDEQICFSDVKTDQTDTANRSLLPLIPQTPQTSTKSPATSAGLGIAPVFLLTGFAPWIPASWASSSVVSLSVYLRDYSTSQRLPEPGHLAKSPKTKSSVLHNASNGLHPPLTEHQLTWLGAEDSFFKRTVGV